MKKAIYLLVALSVYFASCTEKIDIKLDESYQRLVVDANITTEYKIQTIKLSKTAGYFSNEQAPTVTGASVYISSADTVINFIDDPSLPGIYKTPVNTKLTAGKTYTLHINNVVIDGKTQNYESTSYVPSVLQMDSITYLQKAPENPWEERFANGTGSNFYMINGWALEDPTPGQYYLWNYYKNGSLQTDTASEWVFVDDELVNGNYIGGMTIFYIRADVNDTISVTTESTTKEFFEYMNALRTETGGSGGPFSGPPANVKGNINNGALGYFRTSDVKVNSIILKE